MPNEARALARLRERTNRAVRRAMARNGVELWQWKGQWNRYLIWAQWARRLNVPTERLVTVLVAHYRRVRRIRGPRLGIGIAMLTGPKAKAYAFGALRAVGSRDLPPGRPETPDEYGRRMEQAREGLGGRKRCWRQGPGWSGSAVRILRGGQPDAVLQSWQVK